MPAVRTQRAHRDALVCLASEKYYNGDEPSHGALEYEINDIDANGTPLERRECDVHLYRPNVLGHSTARTLQPASKLGTVLNLYLSQALSRSSNTSSSRALKINDPY